MTLESQSGGGAPRREAEGGTQGSGITETATPEWICRGRLAPVPREHHHNHEKYISEGSPSTQRFAVVLLRVSEITVGNAATLGVSKCSGDNWILGCRGPSGGSSSAKAKWAWLQ